MHYRRSDSYLKPFLYIMLVVYLIGLGEGSPEIIKVGGIFETLDDVQEMAFRYAVHRINSDPNLLPNSRLSAKIERIKSHSSFHASKAACTLLKKGVVAIFGPSSISSRALVQSIADSLHIPHFEITPDYYQKYGQYTVNLYPDIHLLGKAIYDLIKSKNWRSFTIVYENYEELVKLQELVKLRNQNILKVTLRQYTASYQYNKILKDIRKRGETNVVLDVPESHLQEIMIEAQKAGMLTEYHNYILTSLNFHTLDLSNLHHCRSNISAFRIVDPDQRYYSEAKKWIFSGSWTEQSPKQDNNNNNNPLKTETALLVDAVSFLATTLERQSVLPNSIPKDFVSCDNASVWIYGYDFLNAMKKVQAKGLTYYIQVDENGYRTNFSLDLLELKAKSLIKIGEWTPLGNLTLNRRYPTDVKEKIGIQNVTLRVTSIESKPYTIKKIGDYYYGNDRFEGYCVDLIQEICSRLHWKFEYRLVGDNNYGKKHSNGTWDGMIGEVMKREVDLAIADLTITLEREEVVDFTMPFMNLGISILFKKPVKNTPKLFSFLAPFSFEVWVYVATAYLGVSLLLFVLARISPFEWTSPHPCNPKTEYLENTFSLLNSFWFTIGSLMQQGSDIAPKAVSTRTVAALWWFFTLIMISSYTANLAAFLTSERMKSPIESADDLARQNEIQYGCVGAGSTRGFFQESKLQPYKRMWTVMQSTQPSVFTKTNNQGVERVKKGNYAFLMESTSIEYHTERDCELAQIGNWLDSKGYGIATPPGSPYRAEISSQILKLQEEGFLHLLKDRWWKEKGGGLCVDEDKKPSASIELGLTSVGGVFVVLLAGLAMATVVAVIEFIWRTKKIPRDERRMVLLEILHELKDICKCRGSSRPPPNYLNGDPPADNTDNGFALHPTTSYNTISASSHDQLS